MNSSNCTARGRGNATKKVRFHSRFHHFSSGTDRLYPSAGSAAAPTDTRRGRGRRVVSGPGDGRADQTPQPGLAESAAGAGEGGPLRGGSGPGPGAGGRCLGAAGGRHAALGGGRPTGGDSLGLDLAGHVL